MLFRSNDGRFILKISSDKTQMFTITVFNNLGMTVYKTNDMLAAGTVQRTIDLRPSPDGIYSVEMVSNDQHIVKRFVINK